MPVRAWLASASDIEVAASLNLLRSTRDDAVHILAAEAPETPPVASCSLFFRTSPEGLARAFGQPVATFGLDPTVAYCLLDGFTAPVGDPWRGYVKALTETALQKARDLGADSVVIDTFEQGTATRDVLATLGFAPVADRHRLWMRDLNP